MRSRDVSASRGGSTVAAWSPPRREAWLVGLPAALVLTPGRRNDALAQCAPRARVPRATDAVNDAGVAALKALGDREQLRGRRDRGRDRRSPPRTSRTTARSSSSTTRATGSTPRRRPRCRPTSRAAAASSASARAAEAETGQHVRHRPDRRAPRRREPDRRPRPGRRRPATACIPSTHEPPARVDAQRRLVPLDHAADGHGPHRRALPRARRAGRRRHDHRRHRLADLLVPRLPGRPLLLHRHGPHRGRYGQANFRKHLLGAIQWSAGLVRGGCKATILSNYSTERVVNAASGDLANTRRVARRLAGHQRLGDLHRPRRLPHRRRARRDDRPGLDARGSSTSPTATSASAAARSTSGIRRPPTAPSTAASPRPASARSTATVGPETRSTARSRPACSASPPSPDFTTTGHIYLQYFPTFNPDNPVHPGLADGDQRRITKMRQGRASRASRSISRPRSSSSTPRS